MSTATPPRSPLSSRKNVVSTMRGGSAAAAVLPVAGMQQARGSALRFFGEGQTRDRDTPAGRPVGHAGGPWAGPTGNDSAGGAEGLGDTPAALLEEMASGIDEMCGVQQVIKTTFTALHDVIKAQGLAIKALERDMKAKASVAEVDGALQQKANISDVNSSLQDVCVALEKKANTWDLDSKLDRSEMHDMMQVKAAADGAAAELSGSYSAQNVDVLRSQLERAVSSIKSDLDKLSNEVHGNLAEVREETRAVLERKLDVGPFEEKFRLGWGGAQGSVAQLLAGKSDTCTVEALGASLRDQLEELRQQAQEQVRASARSRESDTEEFGVASRKHGAAIEALQNTVLQIRGEVAHRAEEAERCDLEIRCKLTELQAELLAADRSTRDQVHAGMLEMSERMIKEQHEARRDAEEQREFLDSRLQAETAALKKQLDSYHADSVERADTILRQAARKDQVNGELRNKVDKQDLAREVEVLKSTVLRKHDEVINELRAKADAPLLDKKANWETVTAALGTQEEALKGVSAAFSQSLTEVIQGLKRVELDVASKAPKADTQGKVDACLRDLSSKTRELAAKASMHDVNTLLDGKADVDEVNAALLEINRQMNLKASLSEVSDTLREQALLNSALITELCLGRWIWKSLKTKHGGAVPWNMQTANSDPDNLLWEKDKAGITCVSPGLYEIQFGFFSRKRPAVVVNLNGERIMSISAAPASWPVQHHAGARHLSSGRYTASSVTGLTHVDFIVLPAKAKLSLAYQGDDDAEGFLTLRKL